jgi:hypothetical protein
MCVLVVIVTCIWRYVVCIMCVLVVIVTCIWRYVAHYFSYTR